MSNGHPCWSEGPDSYGRSFNVFSRSEISQDLVDPVIGISGRRRQGRLAGPSDVGALISLGREDSCAQPRPCALSSPGIRGTWRARVEWGCVTSVLVSVLAGEARAAG